MTEIKMAIELAEIAASEISHKSTELLALQEKQNYLAEEIVNFRPDNKEANLLELATKKDSEKIAEIKSWIKDVNPNYSPFTPYGENCGTCAWVVHNRLNGAKDIVAGRINIAPYDADMEELTGLQCKYMQPSDIENILRSRGPNSELIVGICRANGAGHWFNVVYDGKDFYTVDGQCGKVMEWPHDYGDISAWCALV